MFCPKCKAEYREGFTNCTHCHVSLVEWLQEDQEKPQASGYDAEYIEYKQVLSTYNLGDIAIIKSILDGENIDYYFQGENFHSIRPRVEPAILMAKASQLQEVIELIKDVDLHYMLIASS